MTMLQRLKRDYKPDEPIILSQIDYPDKSKAALKNSLKRLVDKGQLERYDKGIYYLPKESRLGGKSKLSASKVIINRYIGTSKEIYGFISGMRLLNELGLTNQVPNTYEIVTNQIRTKTIYTEVSGFKVKLIKPVIEITNETLPVLKVLTLINYRQFTDLPFERKREILNKIGVNKENVRQLATLVGELPAKESVKIIQSEVINAAS